MTSSSSWSRTTAPPPSSSRPPPGTGRPCRTCSGAASRYRCNYWWKIFVASQKYLLQLVPAYPLILAMSVDTLEVRSQVNGTLLQILHLPKLKFLSAKEGAHFKLNTDYRIIAL